MENLPQGYGEFIPLYAVLALDHYTPATGKTIVVKISKGGGAFADPSGGATNAVEIGDGWYYAPLSGTDTDTFGPLIVKGTAATIDQIGVTLRVVNAHNAGFNGIPNDDSSTWIEALLTDTAAAVWAEAARTLTDKTGFALTSAYDPAKTASQAGDAMALTSGERATLAGVVWANATRTLSSFGTLVADVATAVWGAVTRSLTDKALFTLTTAYDPAKTAAQAGDAMTLTAGERTSIGTAAWVSATRSLTDKANFTLTSDYDPAKTAAPTVAAIADKMLGRNLAGGSDGGRTVQDALRVLRNKVSISGTTLTVCDESDDPAWTAELSTDAAADPIIEVAPV